MQDPFRGAKNAVKNNNKERVPFLNLNIPRESYFVIYFCRKFLQQI